MGWDDTSESVCQIARGLSLVGDRWTLLIMREIGMGIHRFEDIQAQTGMSSNLLAMRLKRLEENGILERRQYSAHVNRFEYFATTKGKELDAVLLAIRAWSWKWAGFAPDCEPSVTLVFRRSGELIDPSWQIPSDAYPFTFNDVDIYLSDAFLQEREARAAAFRQHRKKADLIMASSSIKLQVKVTAPETEIPPKRS